MSKSKSKTNFERILECAKKCTSTDLTRLALCGVRVELCTDEQFFQVTATDGHIIFTHKIDKDEFFAGFKFEFGFEFPTTVLSCTIFPEKKTRQALNRELIDLDLSYPKWRNIIPSEFTHVSEVKHHSTYNDKMLKTFNTIMTTMTGYKYLTGPQYSNSSVSLGVSQLEDGLVGLMPLRIVPEKKGINSDTTLRVSF